MDRIQKAFLRTITTKIWSIEPAWGLGRLANFHYNLELWQGGADRKDLGIGMREHMTTVRFMSAEQPGIATVITSDSFGAFETGTKVPENSIARVELSGPMFMDDDFCSMGMKSFSKVLRSLDSNPNVQGVLIDVDSGGGEAFAGQLMSQTVGDLTKPTVALIHMAASAAYEGVVRADSLIALGETSIIGSIGTLYSLNMEFIEWYSENIKDVYSTLSPNKNKAFRDLVESKGEDVSGFESLANEFAKAFQNEVKANRPLTGNVENTLSGEVFLAKKAKSRGLIDFIGSETFAINKLRNLISKQ